MAHGHGLSMTSEDMRVELATEEKYLLDRVTRVEKHFAALALDVGLMIRKVAKMRNRGDKMMGSLRSHSEEEAGTMKNSLVNISECFGALEDYRQALVDRMEAKVDMPLRNFESICKKAKDEIKDSNASRDKELNKQRQLDKLRMKDPGNRKKITQFESDVQKAKVDCLRVSGALEEYMLNFERKKIQEYKSVMSEFVHSQMLFHAKALELYTLAYQEVQVINEEEQAELFLQGLHPKRRGSQLNLHTAGLYRTNSDPTLAGSTTRPTSQQSH